MRSFAGSRLLLLTALVAATTAACSSKSEPHAEAPAATSHADHHHGHHHEQEASDLDRPLAALLAATCEHQIKAFTCDECRYEVGMVKAAESLFTKKLLRRAKVELKTVATPLRLTGEARFDERRVAHLSTLADGIIVRVHVTLGDSVKQGQPLIELESVAVGEAEADYLEAQGLLRLARRNHDRTATLREEGISSEKELLVASQALEAAQIRFDAALGKLTRLGKLAAAARSLSPTTSKGRLTLRAPVSGTVLELRAVAGEVARAETPLATVGDSAALWVWADLYERDIALVTRAQAVKKLDAVIRVKAFPGEEFAGTVDFISPSMSQSLRTIKLRVAVPNPQGRLLAGMFAEVELFLPGEQEALTVPRSAVLQDEGRTFVFIHHEGEYYLRRPVVPGQVFAGLTEIRQGLTGQELVVTDGAFLLKSDVLRAKMGAGCAD